MIGRPSVVNAPQVRRRLRQPQHTFNVRHAPYEIQPFCIAPVLAGETMEAFTMQTRALTNPLKASLIGWWLEHYFFYVRLTDIDYYYSSKTFEEMLINDTAISGHTDWRAAAAADRFYYWSPDGAGTATGMDYVRACLKVVTAAYFRDEGAIWSQYVIDGNPAAYLQNTTAFESAILEASMDTALDVPIPVDATPVPDTVSVRDVVAALEQWELLREQGLTQMTYEDYLRSEGIRQPTEDRHVPELLRYFRDWQYPASFVVPDTVTAGDSDVTSAVSWVIRGRADKKRFFREPGFIFGVTCARPKVYLQAQKLPLVSLMTDSKDWQPRVLLGSAEGGMKRITDAATDVLSGVGTGDWWIDLRDLFVFGDQFVAGDAVDLSSATDINKMLLPDANLDTRGPVQASVDAMFVSGDATGGVRQDGVARFQIQSRVSNTTPRGSVLRMVS